MDTGSMAASAENLHQDSDDPDRSINVKVKQKRGFLGNLKNKIFGHKKKRTKSEDSVQSKGTSDSLGDGVQVPTGSSESCEERLGNGIFAPAEDLNFPKTGIVGMKNTSASLEALSSGSKLKSELERKLVNRRSLEDDGLPGSPIGTPTGDTISNTNLIGYDSHRFDRDSDGSLLSIGSSENEEDSFFKNPWKGAHTSAVRRPRHGTLSSDSEPEDTLDFDAIGKTRNLSNSAAMHKRDVRPRHRNKARRVTSTTRQMPSLVEKKTLEIAHTFLDDGDSSALKLRGVDTAATSSAVRRVDSGRSRTSPSSQRKSESVSSSEVTGSKSPRPSSAHPSSSHRKQHSEELNSHEAELLSRFQKMRPQTAVESAEVSVESHHGEQQSAAASEQNTPGNSQPPRPPKTVGFTSTPPLQRRPKPPAVQPRPKSMFPQQVRSRTHEVQGSKVEEALTTLAHSKSFNATEHGKPSPEAVLRSKASRDATDDSVDQVLPEWAKLAKRKTWAVAEPSGEGPQAHFDTPTADKKPIPVPRAKPDSIKVVDQLKKEQTTPVTSELHCMLSQMHAKSEKTCDGDKNVGNSATGNCLVDGGVGAMPTKRASVGIVSNSSQENLVMVVTPNQRLSDEGAKAKARTVKSTQANGIETSAAAVEHSWKASVKGRTGSLKPSTTGSADAGSFLSTPSVQQKPAWKSATMKERTSSSSFLSVSTEALDDLGKVRAKSSTLEARTPPGRMTMSETSALDSPSGQPAAGEEPKSFKDRLKMFQSQ